MKQIVLLRRLVNDVNKKMEKINEILNEYDDCCHKCSAGRSNQKLTCDCRCDDCFELVDDCLCYHVCINSNEFYIKCDCGDCELEGGK